MKNFRFVMNNMTATDDKYLPLLSAKEVKFARDFHASIPGYEETPLANLQQMAGELGIAQLKVKDESWRFGLNAFKSLGGSYAAARYVGKRLGLSSDELRCAVLTGAGARGRAGRITFYTATDGNHGRGLAWSAKMLGQKAVIFMPRGTTEERVRHIKQLGARVTVENLDYDGCVRKAEAAAETDRCGVLVQDVSWSGYEEIPNWIMQGYGTMAAEAAEQFGERPTHILLQAGVGSTAAAVTGYFANIYKENPPVVIVAEPENAACLYESALLADGKPHTATGNGETIMAGLNCGTPSITAWDILRNHVHCFVSVSDRTAVRGMRLLAAPLKGDPQVVSGESGAVTMGVLYTLLTGRRFAALRKRLQLTNESRVLLFSTEGDTDHARWKRIVWEGKLR